MKFINALNKLPGIGSQRLKLLLGYFETPENAWKADKSSLIKSGISPALSEKMISEKNNIDPDQEWERLAREEIRLITMRDQKYPELLKESANPPYIIYTRGKADILTQPMIAVVGSRKFTSYGSQAAFALSRDLVKAGLVVVSGMALGIDAMAHRGAMDGGGKTIAVLGNSLDDKNIQPRYNFNLSREIMENGILLSDYPVETPAGNLTFPARNRIIAGLTLGTVVVEAGEKSGALITAQMALEDNREVFSVPGSIFSSQSVGTNALIKKGAKAVTGVADILAELNWTVDFSNNKKIIPKIPSNAEEEKILKILSSEPVHIDAIGKMSGLVTAQLSGALSMMEIKGWIKNIGGQNYIII